MWNDVLQFVVFTVSILGAAWLAIANVPGGWSGTWTAYEAAGKYQVWDPRLDMSLRMGTWALMLGQFVENLSAYATDQSLVQRYLTATSVKVCRQAFIANIVGVFLVLPGLMLLGVGLSGYYRAMPDRLATAPIEYFARKPADLRKAKELAKDMGAARQMAGDEWTRRAMTDPSMLRQDLTQRYQQNPQLAEKDLSEVNRQDEVMPLFVRKEMPRGLIGLVIAALLAATMSSIAGGIHSIATSIVVDIKGRVFGSHSDPDSPDGLRFIRVLTLVLGLLATGLACVVNRLGPVFDMNKKLNGLFSGPLLAVFTLAFFFPRAKALPVLIAAVAGAGFTAWLTSLSEVHGLPSLMTTTGTISPMWFCVIGFVSTWVIGILGSLMVSAPKGPAKTVHS
jgi:Na+/proline symporter